MLNFKGAVSWQPAPRCRTPPGSFPEFGLPAGLNVELELLVLDRVAGKASAWALSSALAISLAISSECGTACKPGGSSDVGSQWIVRPEKT